MFHDVGRVGSGQLQLHFLNKRERGVLEVTFGCARFVSEVCRHSRRQGVVFSSATNWVRTTSGVRVKDTVSVRLGALGAEERLTLPRRLLGRFQEGWCVAKPDLTDPCGRDNPVFVHSAGPCRRGWSWSVEESPLGRRWCTLSEMILFEYGKPYAHVELYAS